MKNCRFCGETIAEQDEICANCGYNPQTDTMTTGFVKKNRKTDKRQNMVSPGIKSFARWGMVIVILSLGFKYQSKVGDIIWKMRNLALGDKAAKSGKTSAKASPSVPAKLIDVRSYTAPADKANGQDRKIEGVFYDPKGKSYVLINGHLVSEKESFGNMVIQKINSDSVEALEDGKQLILRVHQ